jgi:hypothetical protein
MRETGEEEHQVRLEEFAALLRQRHRVDRHAVARAELDEVEPSDRGGELVLAAHVLGDDVLLHVDRFHAELEVPHRFALQRVQAAKKADREGGARPHARPRGDVAVVMDLDARLDLQVFEAGAHGRVLDVLDVLGQLDQRVGDAVMVFEERR